MIYTLTIPGEPVAKARPRVVNGHGFTPAKTKNYETLVKELYWAKYYDQAQLKGPIKMTVNAYFQIPKNVPMKKKMDMLAGIERPTKRPDADNIIKCVADALNGIAYIDDSAIVEVVAGKFWTERPRVEVEIMEIGEVG